MRVSKRTGHVLQMPPEAEATVDYPKKSAYKRKHIDDFNSLIIQLKYIYSSNKCAGLT